MAEDKDSGMQKKGVDFSKRAFLKTALIGGIAVASGSMIAKKISSNMPKADLKSAYVDDEIQQDKAMKGKEYVLMSKEEKDQMVQMFASEYSYKA